MAVSLSSPVTGGAQTGFTSPTYTVVSDNGPSVNSKQWYVSALGGTQSGVTTHTLASPFTATFFRPATFAQLGKANPVTGLISNVPMNTFKNIFRKGVLPLAGQPYRVATIRVVVDIPAGADTADAANVRALYSLAIGCLNQQSAGLGDTTIQGVL